MLSASSTLLYSTLFIFIISLILLFKTYKQKPKKNQSHHISSFVIDGIKIYGKRSFSSIVQLLTYTSLVLLLLSQLFNKSFLWDQIIAFFIGGLSMSLTLFILTGLIPKLIPSIIEKSKQYLTSTLSLQFNIVFFIGFISISTITLIGYLLISIGSYPLLTGYTLGIIFSSFFTRIGGGLFKSCSHIGNSISQTRNKNLPINDIRNPGHIINISADYIHKLCGFCSDIIGSFSLSILAIMMFVYAFTKHAMLTQDNIIILTNFPLYMLSISCLGSLAGYLFARYRISKKETKNTLLEALYIALGICGIGSYILANKTLSNLSLPASIWTGWEHFSPFTAYITGLLGAAILCYTSEILTSSHYKTSKSCAKQMEFGSASIYLFSLGHGFKSNALYLLYIISICLISFKSAGLYGIAITTTAMVSLSATIIAINSFSPLAKSAHQIAKLSTDSITIHTHTKKMDILGQSTIAIGNGFSSIIAILSSFSLCIACICNSGYELSSLFSINLLWFAGLLLGSSLPLIASGYLASVTHKTSLFICNEIKRQFEEIPFLKEGKAHPDIIKCSDSIVRQCMDGLIIPGILIALIPILVGYFLSLSTLIALAFGALLTSIILGFYWATSGEIVSNASMHIENGHYGGKENPFYEGLIQNNAIGSIYRNVLSPSLAVYIKCIAILTSIIIIFVS